MLHVVSTMHKTHILPTNQSTTNAIDFSVVEHLAIHSSDQGN
jgi:hypothetical protein